MTERTLPPSAYRHMNQTWDSPDFDPRNPSAIPMMIEAGFRDVVRQLSRIACAQEYALGMSPEKFDRDGAGA